MANWILRRYRGFFAARRRQDRQISCYVTTGKIGLSCAAAKMQERERFQRLFRGFIVNHHQDH